MRDKYYINLNDKEYFDALSSLVSKRNKLIQSGILPDVLTKRRIRLSAAFR